MRAVQDGFVLHREDVYAAAGAARPGLRRLAAVPQRVAKVPIVGLVAHGLAGALRDARALAGAAVRAEAALPVAAVALRALVVAAAVDDARAGRSTGRERAARWEAAAADANAVAGAAAVAARLGGGGWGPRVEGDKAPLCSDCITSTALSYMTVRCMRLEAFVRMVGPLQFVPDAHAPSPW